MPERLPRITGRQLLAALERDGWVRLRQRGSHVRLSHPDRSGKVTVSVHAGATLKPATLRSVLAQADMTVDDLIALL